MADTDQKDTKQDTKNEESFPSGTRFFRTAIASLFIQTGKPLAKEGGVAPQGVRFKPYLYERHDGDISKFGYLATNDSKALAKLEADGNVAEIQEEEYLEETDTSNPKIKKARE